MPDPNTTTPGPDPAPDLARLAAAREPVTQDDRRLTDAALVDLYWRTTGDDWAIPDDVMIRFGRAVLAAGYTRPSVPTVTALPPSRSLHGQGANEPWHFEHRPPTVTATEVREAARVLYEQAAADDWSGWENEPDEVQRTWIARVHDSVVALGIEVQP